MSYSFREYYEYRQQNEAGIGNFFRSLIGRKKAPPEPEPDPALGGAKVVYRPTVDRYAKPAGSPPRTEPTAAIPASPTLSQYSAPRPVAKERVPIETKYLPQIVTWLKAEGKLKPGESVEQLKVHQLLKQEIIGELIKRGHTSKDIEREVDKDYSAFLPYMNKLGVGYDLSSRIAHAIREMNYTSGPMWKVAGDEDDTWGGVAKGIKRDAPSYEKFKALVAKRGMPTGQPDPQTKMAYGHGEDIAVSPGTLRKYKKIHSEEP